MINTHTPGPWRWEDNTLIGANDCFVDKDDAADARLISAAPDLLEALEGARIALTAYKNWMSLQTDGKTDFPFGKYAEEKAREAIRKAKGEI
jgi:hypothetical protein